MKTPQRLISEIESAFPAKLILSKIIATLNRKNLHTINNFPLKVAPFRTEACYSAVPL